MYKHKCTYINITPHKWTVEHSFNYFRQKRLQFPNRNCWRNILQIFWCLHSKDSGSTLEVPGNIYQFTRKIITRPVLAFMHLCLHNKVTMHNYKKLLRPQLKVFWNEWNVKCELTKPFVMGFYFSVVFYMCPDYKRKYLKFYLFISSIA